VDLTVLVRDSRDLRPLTKERLRKMENGALVAKLSILVRVLLRPAGAIGVEHRVIPLMNALIKQDVINVEIQSTVLPIVLK
jgi:hypothetical protein